MLGGLQIGFNDVMQILILYVGIYALIRFVRGTRTYTLQEGITVSPLV